MTDFHAAPIPLAVGSVIHPGNWGRIIRNHYPMPNTNVVLPYREAIFEYARQSLAPNKVSRFSCVFVLPTLAEAQTYRKAKGPVNFIYEVEPIGDTTGSHTTDYELVALPQNGQQCFQVVDLAKQYWLPPEKIANLEILLPCPVKIVALSDGPHIP